MKPATTQKIELRKAIRYALSAPTQFWWRAMEGIGRSGVTRDVSTAGVFVVCTCCPPAGAKVQIEIQLPRLDGRAVGVRLHGEGIVSRVEPENSKISGFAASLHFYPEPPDESMLANQVKP